MEEKKKSKKKTILVVVVVMFLLIAIAGSDDNQSTNTTVATSTNVAEENQEENSAINKIIKQATAAIEVQHKGEAMYDSYELYKTTKNGTKVYKLKYTSSYENIYYYQLVSFNDDYTQLEKYTDLFTFHNINGKEMGPTQEMEYAYKTTFEDYYEEIKDLYE